MIDTAGQHTLEQKAVGNNHLTAAGDAVTGAAPPAAAASHTCARLGPCLPDARPSTRPEKAVLLYTFLAENLTTEF